MPVRLNGSTSGYVDIAAPAVAGTTTVTLPSSSSTLLSSVGDQTTTGTFVMSSPYTMRNKIINGAMVIDQRNAGASTSVGTATAVYTLDRWRVYHDTAITSNITAQQSSTVPSTGFINSQILTNGTGTSPAAGDFNVIQQRVEGFNIADLNYGSSTAATTTLSFWVRSSLTGTFGFGITNSNQDRSVVYTYTISSANTWEQKTITIAGDQSGTWLTTNGAGLILSWDLGSGTNSNAAATGTWYGARYVRTSACTNFIGTTGATFYITGVQLERGTVATPFEYRNYQQELAMCQRYYQYNWLNALNGVTAAGNNATLKGLLFVTMRASPTVSLVSGTTINLDVEFVGGATTTPTFDNITSNFFRCRGAISGQTPGTGAPILCTSTTVQASAEL